MGFASRARNHKDPRVKVKIKSISRLERAGAGCNIVAKDGVTQCVCGEGCRRDFQFEYRNECLITLMGRRRQRMRRSPSIYLFVFNFRIPEMQRRR